VHVWAGKTERQGREQERAMRRKTGRLVVMLALYILSNAQSNDLASLARGKRLFLAA
jgi:hypothetical protein